MNAVATSFPPVVELNVGGVFYTTSLSTLTRDADSHLGQWFTGKGKTTLLRDSKGKYFIDRDGVLFRDLDSHLGQWFTEKGKTTLLRDSKGKYFIDRDGVLFRYVLDYLRNQDLVLPENFQEKNRLREEAKFYRIPQLVDLIDKYTGRKPRSATVSATDAGGGTETSDVVAPLDTSKGYVTVSYRGSFAFGRDGLADVKFRKLSRILICGRATLCREVFGDTLNESRDPDHGGQSDRYYTSRFFLKHTFLEQAFDMLQESGFTCVASCGSGTAGVAAQVDMKPGMENTEENRWNHYNEFVFARD